MVVGQEILGKKEVEIAVTIAGMKQRHMFAVVYEDTMFGKVPFLALKRQLPTNELVRVANEMELPVNAAGQKAFPKGKGPKDFVVSGEVATAPETSKRVDDGRDRQAEAFNEKVRTVTGGGGTPNVTPVSLDDVRFEAVHNGKARGLDQDDGYISAVAVEGGTELWIIKVFDSNYTHPDGSVHQVHVRKLGLLDKERLKVSDSAGRVHLVDLKERRVIR